jgi:site-specific DNA-cytosine methylase
MKILQLCFFTNLWSCEHYVESWDIKHGADVLKMPDNYGSKFDLVVAAPPCDQFTKANTQRWEDSPRYFIEVARKCFEICVRSSMWVFENPPGRIERFIPELTLYRLLTWHSNVTNKEYILYGNVLILDTYKNRYGRKCVSNKSKSGREEWEMGLIQSIEASLII